ncbi:MAG TPA: FAD-binding oxidoreductase [Streptosporangiaceae bacterium]|jgi:glycine/D-amino acid oxidase-like deaminating enzyme
MTSRRHVVVVGAGIVGGALAYELASRGVRVTVLERRRPAAMATGAAFAWLNNQAYFRNADGVGESGAHTYFDLHRLALGAWRRLERRLGDLGVRWRGMVTWCEPGAEEQARFDGELARRQAWGGPARRVDAAEIERLVPGCRPGPVGTGFYGPDEGNVDPGVAVAALLGACADLGVDIRWPCAARGVATSGGTVTGVDTADGRIACDAVVFACGVDTPALVADAGIDVRLVESYGAIVHLRPMPRFLGPVVQAPNAHALQRPDGRVLIARHYAGTPVEEARDIDAELMLRDAAEVLPALANAEVERVTVGSRILPADGLPIIGRAPDVPDLRCVATNAGISLGPLLAQLLATEIVDGADVEPLRPYDARRFAGGPDAG